MHWVIQEDLFNEDGHVRLLHALQRLDIPHSVHKVVPFTSQLIPEPDVPEGTPIMVMGATTMVRIAQERGWKPGAFFNDNYNMEVYLQSPWALHMLNNDAIVGTFGGITEEEAQSRTEDGVFFVRPVEDTKTFTGTVMDWDEFSYWQHRVCELGEDDGSSLRAGTRVLVARPKVIYAEYRVYVMRGSVVTGSLYKRGGKPLRERLIDERIMWFVTEQAFSWEPSRAFVMDVAETPEGLRIIEAGCFNAAGFYDSDVNLMAQAAERLARTSPEEQGHGIL